MYRKLLTSREDYQIYVNKIVSRINSCVNKINIMIVDDEPKIVKQIIEYIKSSQKIEKLPKIELKTAAHGEEALYKIEQGLNKTGWVPDVIFTDLEMPIMDGVELCDNLRKDKIFHRLHDIDIIVVSGKIQETKEKIEKHSLSGIQVFSKPLDSYTFPYTVGKILANLAKEKQMTMVIKELVNQNTINIEQKNQLLKELEMANKVQCFLLPDKKKFTIRNAKMDYVFKPMRSIGGDFIDIHYSENHMDKLGFFICDVSGHGVEAAIISSMVKMSLNMWGTFMQNENAVAALKSIKRQMLNKMETHFFTAYLCALNLDNGELIFTRAGHPYLLIIRNDGKNTLEFIHSKGGWIDGYNGNLKTFEEAHEEKRVKLNKGDKVLLYTDGLTEAKGTNGKCLGSVYGGHLDEEIFSDWLRNNVDLSADPTTLCNQILNQFYKFTGTSELDDDLAYLVVEYTGE